MVIHLTMDTSVEDLVEALTHIDSLVSRDQLFNLIVGIDDRVCDLEFTTRLRKHFSRVIDEEYTSDLPQALL